MSDHTERQPYTLRLKYRDATGQEYDEQLVFRAQGVDDLFELMTDHFHRVLPSPHISCDATERPVDCTAEPVSFTDVDGRDILDLFYQWLDETPV